MLILLDDEIDLLDQVLRSWDHWLADEKRSATNEEYELVHILRKRMLANKEK